MAVVVNPGLDRSVMFPLRNGSFHKFTLPAEVETRIDLHNGRQKEMSYNSRGAHQPFRGGLAGVFWIIVLLQNPSSLQLEVTNLPIYQSGKGYKAISKALGLPGTTVRAIIYKWRKHGTVENLPRSGRPTKITPGVQGQLIQEVTKDPQQHPKNCRPHLPQLRERKNNENK
ncbi:hypothetical protein QTP86_009822 [Hemibagrus guttatus]|nr:hypothetical protein QTP86_009822 [Hemibagrus guttatus]